MPLGDWMTGLGHLLGIMKLTFTSLHTYIKTKKTDPGKINKSTMSLDLTHSVSSMSSIGSISGSNIPGVDYKVEIMLNSNRIKLNS